MNYRETEKHFLSYAGLAIWIVILGAGSYAAMLVEREKKSLISRLIRKLSRLQKGKA